MTVVRFTFDAVVSPETAAETEAGITTLRGLEILSDSRPGLEIISTETTEGETDADSPSQ